MENLITALGLINNYEVFIAICIGSVILFIQDQNPISVFSLMLKLSVGSINSLSSSLNKAIPLILAGLGISIMNSVKLWNIGAEGQIFLGAIAVIAALWIIFRTLVDTRLIVDPRIEDK